MGDAPDSPPRADAPSRRKTPASPPRRSPKKAAAARDAEYAALWAEAKREGGLTANLAAWFGGEANERRRAAKDAETPADARREALEARKCADKLAALAVEARDADAAIVHKFAAKAGRDADAAEVFAELPSAAAEEAADPLSRAAQYLETTLQALVEPAPAPTAAATLAAIADASDEPAVVVEEAAGELVAIEGGDQDLDDFDSDDGGGAVTPPPPEEPADEPAAEDFLSDVYHDVGGVVVVERAPEPDFSAKNYIFAEDVLITPDEDAAPAARGAEPKKKSGFRRFFGKRK